MQVSSFRAMNTQVVLAAEGFSWAEAGLKEAREFVESAERRFSRFQPQSELSELNASAGQWHEVSPEMFSLLQHSLEFHRETGGLFDVSILPDLQHIGYDRSMDDIRGRDVGPVKMVGRGGRPALSEVEIDIATPRVRLPQGVAIDLGGIAKGWIVDGAADVLHRHSPACAVSAGGDIVFRGTPIEDRAWTVSVEDPRNPDQSLATLRTGPGAVVTSSVTKRSWTQSGHARHHLIDPRTHEPATGDWLSVTVLAPGVLEAEAYAKAMLIGGYKISGNLMRRRPELGYLVVQQDGTVQTFGATREIWDEQHLAHVQ